MNHCDIRIGSCGFSYKDWRGVFYPETLNADDYLAYYAGHFNFVEIDYTYYRRPESSGSERMCARVPENFLFAVKATGSLTHERAGGWETEARLFIEGIKPYIDSGKLGAVLAQFPFSFHYSEEHRRYLAGLCDALQGLPLCIEFRNAEWQKDSVYKGLDARGVHIVRPDLPDLKDLPEPDDIITGGEAYIRFHGRNDKNWWSGDNVSRYDYLYGDEELAEWAERILETYIHTRRLFLAFNNHHKGQAIRNAFSLQKLLSL